MSGSEESVARAAAGGPHATTAAPHTTPAASGAAAAAAPSPTAAATANTVSAAAAALPLVQLLQQTLSADPGVLRVTQEALDARAAAEEFPKDLLLLLIAADTPPAAKHAGAIYFKNFIRRCWDMDPQQGGISLANRALIKQHLLSLLLAPAAAKAVQLQLADACTRIAATDMPVDWPSLLPELMQQHLLPSLATQQQLLQQLLQQQQRGGVLQHEEAEQEMQQQMQKEIAVLEMLHAVLKKYRTAFRSNDVLLELRQILPVVQQPLLQVFLLALQHLQMLRTAGEAAAAAVNTGTSTATAALRLQQTKQLLCEVLLLCCKAFFSLNTVDIPEFFEDHMQDFFGGFLKLLQVDLLTHASSAQQHQQHEQHDEDNTADVEDKLRTQICINMKLYADKYQEEFQPFVMACVQAVWQMMTRIDRRQKFDFTAAAAMEFLSSAASTAWQPTEGALPAAAGAAAAGGDPFSNVQLLQEICEKTILPNVQLRDCDVEQMEDTPLEFARRELEGGEQHTRRSAALDLVKSLMKLREELITALLLQAVQTLSSQAAAKAATAGRGGTATAAGGTAAAGGGAAAATAAATTPTADEEERLLDACTFLVLAVGVKGSTRVRGVHAVNKNVDTQQFFRSLLLKELQQPDVDSRFIVRIAAIKVVAAFRNVFDIQLLQGVLPLLVLHLSAKRVVVHTFAAYAIERLLSARQNGQLRINTAAAAPLLNQALEVLLQRLQESSHSSSSATAAVSSSSSSVHGGAENEFLVKCILRIISFLKEDAAAAVLPALRVILDSIKRVSNNPFNPSFSHYLFECLATLVKLSSCTSSSSSSTATNSSSSTRAALEREVIPVLSVIVQQTVHEFVPYCFQILGLLLETAAAEEKGMPPATAALYVELYGHLLSPSFWTAAQGNVPALVKLLCCYFYQQQLFPDMIRDSMQQLLQRFQYCLYHKKLSAAGFELLNSIFRLLPFSFYSSFFHMLLTVLLRRVHELNKRLSICKEVALSLMLFQCKCEDPAVLVNTLEAIQTGLWQQVLSFILLPAITASAAAPLHHKKVLILGLARVTTCAAVANNKALLSPTLEALAALIARKEEDERDVHRTRASVKHAAAEEEESIAGYDSLTAAEFDLYYARLAATDMHHSKDMCASVEDRRLCLGGTMLQEDIEEVNVENVTDIQHSVQMCLSPLKADIEELARGGAQVRPLLAVLLAV